MNEHDDLLFADQLSEGLDLGGRWQLINLGPVFTADSGIVESSPDGLRVRSPGTNDTTGEPAMKPAPDLANHLKWVAQLNETATSGFPGRDIPIDGSLRFSVELGVRVFGAHLHPFGEAVLNPESDFRLGAGVMNVMDFETGIVLDFWVINDAIYPFYERIVRPDPYASALAFTSAFPPIPRTAGSVHDLAISLDGETGLAAWHVDGRQVASVARLGHPDQGATVVLSHGGTAQDAQVRQLLGGFGIMTLLDAALPPSNTGLLDLGEHYEFPADFAGGSDAFGQGVEILARNYRIERTHYTAVIPSTREN